MDLTEGVGESSSPPTSFATSGGYDVKTDVFNRLIEIGNDEAVANPLLLRQLLDSHFSRLPSSYALDINVDRAEDVLLHNKLLTLAKDPDNRPVFHVRYLETFWTSADGDDAEQVTHALSTAGQYIEVNTGKMPSHGRSDNMDFEPCYKLEDLNLDVRRNSSKQEGINLVGDFSRSKRQEPLRLHEVIFSTTDKPKLLSQLSALLSDLGLNIREAHVFSTTDGYSLDVFVVDGWPVKDSKDLHKAMEIAIARSERSWSGSLHAQEAAENALVAQATPGDWEIDIRLLKLGECIASGSCGDLFHAVYCGQDVAVKVLKSEHLNDTLEVEFAHEVAILREVQHRNVVRFIGTCTKSPQLCIVTEFMPGGSLYDYLHKTRITMELPQLVKFAIDVCRGMEYLHQNNIIHRDLKTANLLMDAQNCGRSDQLVVGRIRHPGLELMSIQQIVLVFSLN